MNIDKCSVLMIIEAPKGNQAILARYVSDLFLSYFSHNKLRTEFLQLETDDSGGLIELVLEIVGKDVCRNHTIRSFNYINFSGMYGRIKVKVLAGIEEAEMPIKKEDLKIEMFPRSYGACGQTVTFSEQCIRITHLPTGIIVVCRDSQYSMTRIKENAMKILRSKIYDKMESGKIDLTWVEIPDSVSEMNDFLKKGNK